METQLHHGVV